MQVFFSPLQCFSLSVIDIAILHAIWKTRLRYHSSYCSARTLASSQISSIKAENTERRYDIQLWLRVDVVIFCVFVVVSCRGPPRSVPIFKSEEILKDGKNEAFLGSEFKSGKRVDLCFRKSHFLVGGPVIRFTEKMQEASQRLIYWKYEHVSEIHVVPYSNDLWCDRVCLFECGEKWCFYRITCFSEVRNDIGEDDYTSSHVINRKKKRSFQDRFLFNFVVRPICWFQ